MKLIHLSDLHIGKRIYEVSLIEDQKYILNEILRIVGEEKPDGVLIAGDIYDRSDPSAEAVALFDDFLSRLAALAPVFMAAGNHDSAERVSYGSALLARANVHVAPVYGGTVAEADLEDEYGPVHIYMLPFLKPAQVRRFFQNPENTEDTDPEDREGAPIIATYTDAVRAALTGLPAAPQERNVLIAHQFVTGCSISDSEEHSVGGLDQVSAGVFEGFDYVALGHLHHAQQLEGGRIRYCGTPLKYSFSETNDEKTSTIIEMGPKGQVRLRTRPLLPLRDMREVRGTFDEVMARKDPELIASWLRVILTDETDVPDALAKLRTVYPNVLRLDYDNARTRSDEKLEARDAGKISPEELFADFYETQNGVSLEGEAADYLRDLLNELKEAEV